MENSNTTNTHEEVDTEDEDLKEIYDSEDVLIPKIEALAEAIRNSKNLVVFTGAGISTSAGIPDFRGPQGVWTLRSQGKSRTAPSTSVMKAHPTLTHMALVELQNKGILKYVISQNSDGMHRRSGIQPQKLSELHGNSNIEVCNSCKSQFYGDFKVTSSYRFSVHDHRNGRYCPQCGELLRDTIINFGENLSESVLAKAWKETEKADVFISIGSSLLVSPACNMPELVAKNGGKLFIINLQKTPFDEMSVNIHASCDFVLKEVMERLELDIPTWTKKRKIFMQFKNEKESVSLEMGAMDDTLFATMFKKVEVLFEDETVTLETVPFITELKNRRKFTARLHFFGNHEEPPLEISHEISTPLESHTVFFDLTYFLKEKEWKWEKGDLRSGLIFDFPPPKPRPPFDQKQALELLTLKIDSFKKAALLCKQLGEISDAISHARILKLLKNDLERVKNGAVIDVNLLPMEPAINQFMRPRSSKELLTVDVDSMDEPSPVDNIVSHDVLEYEIDQIRLKIAYKEENKKEVPEMFLERLKKLEVKLAKIKEEAKSGNLNEKDYINTLIAKIEEEEIRAQLFLNRRMTEWASQALKRSRIMQSEIRSTVDLQ